MKIDIEDLKAKILQLAISGKLVKQDSEDESAEKLYEKIQEEKGKLIKEKKIRNETIKEIEKDKIPYSIPGSWKWVRLLSISSIKGGKRIPKGKSYSDEKTDYPYLRVTNMKQNTVLDNDMKYIDAETYNEIKNYTINIEDIYITIAGTIGDVGIIPEKFNNINLTENAAKISLYKKDNIMQRYLLYVLKSSMVQGEFIKMINQLAQPKLSLRNIKISIIPLPPLKEQKRIVDKIDKLFSLIDNMEELKQDSINVIDLLEEKVLELAIKGKLVEQDDNDESVEILCKKIQEKKKRLIKEKKAKYRKYDNIKEIDIKYSIPKSWKWVRFNEVYDFQIGKTPARGNIKYWKDGIYPWVSISDMIHGKRIRDTKEKVSEAGYKEFNQGISKKGTLLMSFKLTIGEMSILDTDSFHNEAIVSIYPFYDKNNILRDYFFKVGKSLDLLKDTKSAIKGKTLNSSSIGNILIPLPPLNEQKRIVKKLDSIINYLNKLREQLGEDK